MGITITINSATIGTAAHSLPANTTTGVPTSQTDDCILQTWIAFVSMVAADEFEIKVYEKVNAGAQNLVMPPIRVVGAQTAPVVIPSLILGEGWEVSVVKITGTDRVVNWSLRKVT